MRQPSYLASAVFMRGRRSAGCTHVLNSIKAVLCLQVLLGQVLQLGQAVLEQRTCSASNKHLPLAACMQDGRPRVTWKGIISAQPPTSLQINARVPAYPPELPQYLQGHLDATTDLEILTAQGSSRQLDDDAQVPACSHSQPLAALMADLGSPHAAQSKNFTNQQRLLVSMRLLRLVLLLVPHPL